MTRFSELASDAPERLVRVRGHGIGETDLVLRLNRETLSFEHVLDGPAAPFYSDLVTIKTACGGNSFSPKKLQQEMGMARATCYRLISRLMNASAIRKKDYGEYVLAVSL